MPLRRERIRLAGQAGRAAATAPRGNPGASTGRAGASPEFVCFAGLLSGAGLQFLQVCFKAHQHVVRLHGLAGLDQHLGHDAIYR